MKKPLAIALAAVTAVSGIAFAGEASAQRYRDGRYYDHRRNDDGAAIALGVLAGAALAGNGYAQPYGYYARPYYGHHRGYGYYHRRCWTESRWDPYYGRMHYRVCR